MTGVIPEAGVMDITNMSAKELRETGIHDLLNEAFHEKGNMHLLMRLESGNWIEANSLYLNEVIDKPEDLKGMVLRASGGQRPLLEAFGATVVYHPGPQIYTSMERGLIDGFAYPLVLQFFGYGLPTVTKYFVTPGYGQQSAGLWFNLDVWDSLPKQYQDWMNEAVAETEADWADKTVPIYEGYREKFIEEGMQEIKLSPDGGKRLVKGFYEMYWEKILDKSPELGGKMKIIIEANVKDYPTLQ